MIQMQTWLDTSAAVFIAAMMFAAGAATSGRDIRRVLADRRLLARAFFVNVIVVPAIAAGLARAFHADRAFGTGAVLAAICPGAPFATYLAARTRGNLALAVVLTCGLTVISLITTPLTSLLFFGPRNMVALPGGYGLAVAAVLLLLPVIAGQAVRRRTAPGAAVWIVRVANMLAFAALMCANVAAARLRSSGVRSIGWRGSCLVFSLVLVSMAVGWLSGKSPATRATLATSTGLRNAGLAFLFAEHSFPAGGVELGVAAYSMLMLLPNLAFALAMRSRGASTSLPQQSVR